MLKSFVAPASRAGTVMSTAAEADRSTPPTGDAPPPFCIRRVRLVNYKSFESCDVSLGPLTVLVGRNGAGKSNFLDALAFVGGLSSRSIWDVMDEHGGLLTLLHRTTTTDRMFSVEVTADFFDANTAGVEEVGYRFEYDARLVGPPDRVGETFWLQRGAGKRIFRRSGTPVGSDFGPGDVCMEQVQVSSGYSLLGVATEVAIRQFRTSLRRIRRYSIQPDALRLPQRPGAPTFLKRDGSNAATVYRFLRESGSWRAGRLLSYLQAVVPQVADIRVTGDDYERLEFLWRAGAGDGTWFPAAAMSDGTLRAFGVLLAALQTTESEGDPSVILLEEPEAGLHPAAVRALVDALDEASLRVQVILTTHSPDLLDAEGVTPERVRVVEARDGATVAGPVDEAGAEIVRDHLNTLGGLERDDRLEPGLSAGAGREA